MEVEVGRSAAEEAFFATGLVARLAQRAAERGLALAHWKSNNRLEAAASGEDDLDLSIPASEEYAFRHVLTEFGFVEFRARRWQRAPHVFDLLGLEEETGRLLHIHLHTRLVTGADGVLEQELPWMEQMNRALAPDPVTGVRIPPPAFDAHLLLAREAVKSRNIRAVLRRVTGRHAFSDDAPEELAWLLARCRQEDLDVWGVEMWGAARWQRMRPHLDADLFDREGAFALLRAEVLDALAPYRRGTAFGNAARFLALRLAKLLHARRARLRATPASGMRLIGPRAPIIAIVGCDGSGKSTVVADLRRWLSWKADVAVVYFGTNHGWFRRARGIALSLRSASKPRRTDQSARPPEPNPPLRASAPGWLGPLKWAVMGRLRLHLHRRAERLARAGTIVLADRYPQIEVHGTYDGPSTLNQPGIGLVGRVLQRIEHRSFKKLADARPDLVIKLIVPFDVASARKGDHDPVSLVEKIRLTRDIRFNSSRTVEVDASQPLDAVIREVRRHVWSSIQQAGERQDALH
jgi:thymidylate kinase